jgi:hypothetical protein
LLAKAAKALAVQETTHSGFFSKRTSLRGFGCLSVEVPVVTERLAASFNRCLLE